MFVIQVELLVFVFSYFCSQSRGLERALAEEDIIIVTESAISNVTSNLFIKLNLKNVTFDSKLRRYTLVHNFLTSVTLKDHKTLNEIVSLTRVDKSNISNETEAFVTIINDILNEDWNDTNDSFKQNEDVIQYIDEFLTNLDKFKQNSSIVQDNYESLEIKDEIIHILRSDNANDLKISQFNVTEAKNSEDDDGFLSDTEFWVPELPTRRIYRGTKTKIKYFPFMASVQIFNSFQCAGSIIKSDLVITAASCLQLAWNNRFFRENPAFLSVRVGSNFYQGGGDHIPIMEVYFHPSYNPRNLNHNIAVLRLLRVLKIRKRKRNVKKIEIDREPSALPMNTDGITIVGWGATTSSNVVHDPWKNRLAFAVLDVYHLQECQDIYSREYVTRKNFCAGFISKGAGACNHDVGGPGVVNGRLAGVISFGSPICGTRDAPTVFTKVGFYAEWIDEIMDQDVPRRKRRTTLKPKPWAFTHPPQHLKKTTAKFSPIVTGLDNLTPKPIGIHDIDALRELEDEDLFNEYLSTMFKSKEVDEFKDIINDNTDLRDLDLKPIETNVPKTPKIPKQKDIIPKIQKLPKIHAKPAPNNSKISDRIIPHYTGNNNVGGTKDKQKDVEKIRTESAFITKMDSIIDMDYKIVEDLEEKIEDYEVNNIMTTKKPKAENKYTVLDKSLIMSAESEDPDNSDSLENDIVELIDNIDVSVPSQEYSSGSTSSSDIKEETTKNNKKIASDLPIEKKSFSKMNEIDDDTLLTLLYLSDNEKANKTYDQTESANVDFDDDTSEEGMAISLGGFRDLIFRNNDTAASVLDFMSKNELYDLLYEAINEVTKKKIKK